MEQFFLNMIKISVISSVIVVLVLAITPFVKKRYSSRWRYWLWVILCVMLIFPISISYSNAPITIKLENIESNSSVFTPKSNLETEEAISSLIENQQSVTKTHYNQLITIQFIMYIWTVGVIVLLLWNVAAYLMYKRKIIRWSYKPKEELVNKLFDEVKNNLKVKADINVQICDNINSPILLGLFNPTILLPKNKFANDELRHIFSHELIHYKRHDIIYKMLLFIVKTIHWFNPFIYIMTKLASVDIELCCDDDVIKDKDMEFRRDYLKTIIAVIKLNKNRDLVLSTNFDGGKKIMKDRIEMMMKSSKRKKGTILLISALIITLLACFFVACTDSVESDVSKEYITDEERENNTPSAIEGSKDEESLVEIKIDSGKYQGKVDDNSIEIKISGVPDEIAPKVFLLDDSFKDEFDKLQLEENQEIKFEYYQNEKEQNFITKIYSSF